MRMRGPSTHTYLQLFNSLGQATDINISCHCMTKINNKLQFAKWKSEFMSAQAYAFIYLLHICSRASK